MVEFSTRDGRPVPTAQSTLFEPNRALHDRNHPRVRESHGARALPFRGAFIVALPMKINGGSGAPLRAMAILPK